MTEPEYLCPVRNIKLSIWDKVGRNCYLGSEQDVCLNDDKLCDILQNHAQSLPSRTEAERESRFTLYSEPQIGEVPE